MSGLLVHVDRRGQPHSKELPEKAVQGDLGFERGRSKSAFGFHCLKAFLIVQNASTVLAGVHVISETDVLADGRHTQKLGVEE